MAFFEWDDSKGLSNSDSFPDSFFMPWMTGACLMDDQSPAAMLCFFWNGGWALHRSSVLLFNSSCLCTFKYILKYHKYIFKPLNFTFIRIFYMLLLVYCYIFLSFPFLKAFSIIIVSNKLHQQRNYKPVHPIFLSTYLSSYQMEEKRFRGLHSMLSLDRFINFYVFEAIISI